MFVRFLSVRLVITIVVLIGLGSFLVRGSLEREIVYQTVLYQDSAREYRDYLESLEVSPIRTGVFDKLNLTFNGTSSRDVVALEMGEDEDLVEQELVKVVVEEKEEVVDEDPEEVVVIEEVPEEVVVVSPDQLVSVSSTVFTDIAVVNIVAEPVVIRPELVPRDIQLKSTVALICEFEDGEGGSFLTRGSGVIVHSDGYILTNRHVVDQDFTARFYGIDDNGYFLKDNVCKVYLLNLIFDRIVPPSPQGQYDFYDVSGLPLNYDFLARVRYVPSEESDGLSEYEARSLDVALMEFAGWNEDKYDGRTPPKLLPVPIYGGEVNDNVGVVIPGYAYQAVGSGAFNVLRMLPKIGTFVQVLGGDQSFLGIPLDIILHYRPDAFGGRSGSPIFWKGYMIGLLKTRWVAGISGGEKLQAPQVSVVAIIKLLSDNGLAGVLENLY